MSLALFSYCLLNQSGSQFTLGFDDILIKVKLGVFAVKNFCLIGIFLAEHISNFAVKLILWILVGL